MKDTLTNLLAELKSSTAATKVVIATAVVAIIAVMGYSTYTAGTPHFKLLYSGIDASQAAAIQSALAGGSVRYEVSQPPAPFVIHVDEAQYYAAQNLVALAGALDRAPEGIQTNGSGASQVFLSAPERAQNVLKREWQELEKQLAELDFVSRARVSTSIPESSPVRRSEPMTVAVTLQLVGGTELSKAQAGTVAKLVRYRFNVPRENVIISDQSGHSLFDGSESSSVTEAASGLLEHQARFDADLARKTNTVLDHIFGPGMAYVVVNSNWSYEQKETVKESIDPKNKVVVSETTSKTTTPQGVIAGGGGAAGAGGDPSAAFGSTNAAVPGLADAPATTQELTAETSDTQKTTIVGKETEHRQNTAPELERLSVSLFLDQSLAEKLPSLESSVKASVGFDTTRGDTFSSMATPFASIARDEQGKIIPPPPAAPLEEESFFMEKILPRGVEILAALAFVFVLLKTLKSSAKRSGASADAAKAGESDPRFLELLAKSQVEELVKSDPERVSSILSSWAAEDQELAKASR